MNSFIRVLSSVLLISGLVAIGVQAPALGLLMLAGLGWVVWRS